jgi:hypothetical protein
MTNKEFCEKVWDLALTRDFVIQAADDLNTKIWASDSIARSQFWNIGMNEDTVFGPVQCDDPAMGYWPKEVETTLIGYTNMAFGSKIADGIIDMIEELSIEIDSNMSHLISHLCFMCCRCVAALDARCEKLNHKSFNKYFNLVALKLKGFYQLDDFDEHSFPKCELIALKFLWDHVDDIFAEIDSFAEEVNNDEASKDQDDTYVNCWSLVASDCLWTFRKRHHGKTIDVFLSISGVEVKIYDCYAQKYPGEIFFSSGVAEKLNEWLERILDGKAETSSLYSAVPFGILKGNLVYSWDFLTVKEDPFDFGVPLKMSDGLLELIVSILKQRNFR